VWIMAGESGGTDHREHLPCARLALGAADTAVLGAKGDVVADGAPGQERVLLEYHRRQRGAGMIGLDPDLAGALTKQPGQHAQQRGLAAAARPDDAEKFAGVSLERDQGE